MQKEDGCVGLMGRLFGHKFEARCDNVSNETPTGQWVSQQIPEHILEEAIQTENLEDIVRAMAVNSGKSTYIHDVCVRCGKTIKRQ